MYRPSHVSNLLVDGFALHFIFGHAGVQSALVPWRAHALFCNPCFTCIVWRMDTSVASAFCKGSWKLPCTILCCTIQLHQTIMLTKLVRTHILSKIWEGWRCIDRSMDTCMKIFPQSFLLFPPEKKTLATGCFVKLPNGTMWFYKVGTFGFSSFVKRGRSGRTPSCLLPGAWRRTSMMTDLVMVDAF